MANPLEQSVKSAVRMNGTIGGMIAKVGTGEHPRGFVTSAYRTAQHNIQSAWGADNINGAVSLAMFDLRGSVLSSTRLMFQDAQMIGAEEATRQLEYYGVQSVGDPSTASLRLTTQSNTALDAVMARYNAQEQTARALLLTGATPDQIAGDDERAGVLRPGEVAGAVVFWLTALLWNAFESWANYYSNGLQFQKQAIAALDNRTTDCCLKVHGQVKPLNGTFHLTGDPRFADDLGWPPFHWYCRTSGVLYLPEYDSGLTARMQAAAAAILAERMNGIWNDRDPANAY